LQILRGMHQSSTIGPQRGSCTVELNIAVTWVMEVEIASVLKHHAMRACMGFKVKSFQYC
jgi:hypothetical protein